MTHDEIITGIPLTLEQLRKMDGKPVFACLLTECPVNGALSELSK